MLIEAARGGHSSVVGLLLQQPKFTAALKNQIAQRQLASNRTTDHVTSIAGKRRTRSTTTGGRGKKHPKSPAPRKTDGVISNHDGNELPMISNVTIGGRPVLLNKQQQQFHIQQQQQIMSQPVLCHSDTDISSPKKSPNSNYSSHNENTTIVTDQPPSQLLQNELNDKIVSSVTLHALDKPFDPSEYTVNPSYKFGQPSLVNPDSNIFPVSLPPIQGQYPSPVSNSASAGGNYLLPPIFAQSSAYSNQEHMEAYMKADEILRNHMMQLDYTKQQALMNALESLMLQSEAHRASIGVVSEDEEGSTRVSSPPIVDSNGEGTDVITTTETNNVVQTQSPFKGNDNLVKKEEKNDNVELTANSLKVTSQENIAQSSGTPLWSFTDPSRMPQFSVGVSTLAPSGSSPEKQSPKSSHFPSPGKHLSYAEKQAFASRIASRLEQVKKSPNNQSSSSSSNSNNTVSSDYYSGTPVTTQFFNSTDGQTPFHPPLVYNNFNFGSNVDNHADSMSPRSGFCSPITSPFKPPSCVQTTTPNTITSSSTAPLELNQLPPVPSPYLQPIYSPDLSNLKHLTHHIPSDTTQQFDPNDNRTSLTSSIWLDANFPLDIPPPSDLIPDHVSTCSTIITHYKHGCTLQ